MASINLPAVVLAICLVGGGVGWVSAAEDPPAYSDENVGLIRELMRRRGGDPAALAQLVQLTRTCSPAKTAELFDELAAAHQRAGNLNLAAETRQLLVERLPDEPAARKALTWLVRLYASSEVAHAHRPPTQAATSGGLALVLREESATLASAETPAEKPNADVALPTYALYLARNAAVIKPALVDDPALTFQRAAAARRVGELKTAQGFLVLLKHARAGDSWGDCARMENWLAEAREAPPPKPITHVALTNSPPHLDGVLDEPCWQRDAAAVGDAQVWLVYDQEYLYAAVKCAKAAGVEYLRDSRPRTHDGDVGKFDHVRILLDLDRDYATWFELAVDSRGWTADRAWGDAAWNPEWFVASGQASEAWTAEAAIPLSELGERPPRKGDAWACRMERRAPSNLAESWPATEKTRGPQRYGLLLFE